VHKIKGEIMMQKLLYRLFDNYSIDELIHFVDIHGIPSLVYEEVIKDNHDTSIQLRKLLKNRSMIMGISIKNMQKKALAIISILNEKNIDYCVLKGIALMSYYERSYHRHMSDLDLWVRKECLDSVITVLGEQGYEITHKEGQEKHIVMERLNSIKVEIHFELVEPWSIGSYHQINDEYWEKRTSMMIEGIEVPILGLESHYRYLIFHMLAHFCYSGFGIKQLIDLVMIVNSGEIDPNNHVEYFNSLGYGVFYQYLIVLCAKYLGMDTGDCIDYDIDESTLERLVSTIIESGAFGNHSEEMKRKTTKHYRIKTYYSNKLMPLWWYSIFPIKEELGIKYFYAQKHSLLLPIAWCHRLIQGFFKNDITFKEKVDYFLKYEKLDEKEDLLASLGIKY